MKKKLKKIFISATTIILLILSSLLILSINNNDIELEKETITPVKEIVDYKDKPIKKEFLNNPSNLITIDGVLQNRLMDDDGSYYYLDHNINGEYDQIGIPIIDFRTNFETRKTLIYAHSTLAGNGPFQALQNYPNNPDYYNAHKYISIHYNDKDYKYEIFSVYISLAENQNSYELEYFYNTEYTNYDWGRILKYYKSRSDYDTGVKVSKNDKIIILQTCSIDPNYYEKYYRYNILVFAKLIKE